MLFTAVTIVWPGTCLYTCKPAWVLPAICVSFNSLVIWMKVIFCQECSAYKLLKIKKIIYSIVNVVTVTCVSHICFRCSYMRDICIWLHFCNISLTMLSLYLHFVFVSLSMHNVITADRWCYFQIIIILAYFYCATTPEWKWSSRQQTVTGGALQSYLTVIGESE